MRKFVCICLFLLVFASSAVADAWTHRAAITVNNAGGMVTDYTLRVSFGAADSLLFDRSQANGADWRFRKKDGLTTLNHWVQWWGTDRDTAIVLVRLDRLQPGTDTLYVYVGNDTASSTSNGAATCALFQDFNTDYTVSGVTDILHMQGLGVDSFSSIVMDTFAAGRQFARVEEGNVLCDTIPGVPDSLRYLHIYSARGPESTRSDSFWMYLETSSDGFVFTRRGRLDTLGGKPACDSARGQGAYSIVFDDTIWTYYEYKCDFPTCSPGGTKCDRIGICYSADYGQSWTFKGKVISDSSAKYSWLVSPSSPTAIVWDTSNAQYPLRTYNVYLAVESKGVYGGKDCGGGMMALFGAQHPLETYDTVACFPCSLAAPGLNYYRSGAPDQFFNVNDSLYLDGHVGHGSHNGWLQGRFLLSNDMRSFSSARYFTSDSMIAGAIVSQDIFNDSTWMAWEAAHTGGAATLTGADLRYRTMFTDPSAVPSGWTAFWRNSNFGFHEARNGQLLLAAEPFREDSGSAAIGLVSDIGFDTDFVVEYRMKLKWNTLTPLAVVSIGAGKPASLSTYLLSYEVGMDSGYGISYLYSRTHPLFYLTPGWGCTPMGTTATIPDSIKNTWRVHHLAYSGDTLRWWADGSASSLRPKGYGILYKVGAKRVMLASGDGHARSGHTARGARMNVDWVLVRPYRYPEPTFTVGPLEDAAHSYVHFDTVLVADHDAWLCEETASGGWNPAYNYGKNDTVIAGMTTGPYAYYGLFHYDLSWLAHSPDSVVTVTSAIDCFYVFWKFGTAGVESLFAINQDWFEGDSFRTAADSQGCCWNHAGWSKYGGKSVCGDSIGRSGFAWGSPKIGATCYDTVTISSSTMWCVCDGVVPLVQGLIDSGKAKAFGIAVARPHSTDNKWCRIRSREYASAAYRPRLRVAGYYTTTVPLQPTVVVQEEDGYVRLNWTNTGAPLYRVLSSTAAGGPYSLLFSTGDTTATVARTDTAAVRCFYQVISASQ